MPHGVGGEDEAPVDGGMPAVEQIACRRAQLISRIAVSDRLAVVKIALEEDFHFCPGQYATLWLTHQGSTVSRPYSIASSPSSRRVLEFYVSFADGGGFTSLLKNPEVMQRLEAARPGTRLEVSGPAGTMCLEKEETRDLLLIASGTGLAPFVSMVKYLDEAYTNAPDALPRRRVTVIHGVSRSADLGYRGEMDRLSRKTLLDPLRRLAVVYLPTVSRPWEDPGWEGLQGRVEALLEAIALVQRSPMGPRGQVSALLQTQLSPGRHLVYVCGHHGTVRRVSEILSRRGFRPDIDFRREHSVSRP